MNGRCSHACYRSLTRLYPKPFRTEYRDDLVSLFAEQLREEPATRVWLRALRDLLVTVPTQHLEARMHRPTARTVAMIASCVTFAALVLGVIAGTGPVVGVFLAVAILGLVVATASWRAARPLAPAAGGRRQWRAPLALGVVLLAAVIVVINVPPYADDELSEPAWVLMMLSLVTSVALITIGLTLAVAQRVARPRTT